MHTQSSHFTHKLKLGAFLLAIATASPVIAQTILVTPGSLANYTYITPGSGTGSGGGGTGDNVSTLQRCFWAPTTADETRTVADGFYDYTKEVTVYFRVAGGNGGASAVGGGGGSSAILKNGTVVAMGKGGDGGQAAPEVSGTFTIKKGDVLRFVTGGGGGDGISTSRFSYYFHIGGGGGAGYTGGGAGGSMAGRNLTGSDTTTSGGKGGGTTPGAGGYISGGVSGTAGIGSTGGVSTWSDGSSATVGTSSSGSYINQYLYSVYSSPERRGFRAVKFPATTNQNGSPTGDLLNGGVNQTWDGYFSGGGGRLGVGGGRWAYISSEAPGYCNFSQAVITSNDTFVLIDDNSACNSYYNQYKFLRQNITRYPAHSGDMQLTRTKIPYYQNGNETYEGSLPGQIITMYQAPVCGLIQ